MSNHWSGLFELDTLLPAQFYAAYRRGLGIPAEKRLMIAVLQDALDCYQKHAAARDDGNQRLFEEACSWIASTDRSWFFSYENICETLDINAEYMRRGLDHWRREIPGLERRAVSAAGRIRAAG